MPNPYCVFGGEHIESPDGESQEGVGQTTQFVYDGDGNLVKKIKPGGSRTIYVGGIYEVDKAAGGSIQRTVTYYPVAGAMRINSTLYYTLKDHLGSASVVTDATGATVSGTEQRYYPYGESRLTGTMLTDKLYTGQREMAGLGIYHYGARFYSPKLGRFLSADTIVPGPANPQAYNRYSYVLNNPLRYTDPTGHMQTDGGNGGLGVGGYTYVIEKKHGWKLKGKWSQKEVQTIYQTGSDILAYVDGLTGGNGSDWMNKYLGGVNINHVNANRSSALPGFGGSTINLHQGWLKQDGGARWLAHELGHVWDINTGLFGVYGGVADQLNAEIGGDRLSNPFSCPFCDESGSNNIPLEHQYVPSTAYGNNSTADYLAESFALMVYPNSGPQIPAGIQDWVEGQIFLETARLVIPFGAQMGIP